MSYPGAWIQLANYEARGEGKKWSDGQVGSPAAAADMPPYTYTGDDTAAMSERLSNAQAASLAYSPGQVEAVIIAASVPGLQESLNRWSASNGATRIGPLQSEATGYGEPVYGIQPPSAIIPSPWPAGAVGYEWAAAEGAVEATSLQLLTASASGNSNDFRDFNSNGIANAVGDWRVDLNIIPDQDAPPLSYVGNTLATWTQASNPARSDTLDVSAEAGPSGYFVLLGQATASVSAFDGAGNGGSWGASLYIRPTPSGTSGSPGDARVVPHYTVRPPLFRWLYDTPQTLITANPPEVLYPRSDGLATGSADILYPMPETRQSSGVIYPTVW